MNKKIKQSIKELIKESIFFVIVIVIRPEVDNIAINSFFRYFPPGINLNVNHFLLLQQHPIPPITIRSHRPQFMLINFHILSQILLLIIIPTKLLIILEHKHLPPGVHKVHFRLPWTLENRIVFLLLWIASW